MNSEVQEFIANQFRAGKSITEILARGASQPPGQRWNRLDVQTVLDNEGMKLGLDGRLWVNPDPPRGKPGRKPANPPATAQPGQYVTTEPAPQRIEHLLHEASKHEVAKVRNLAWQINAKIETLRQEIEANSEEAQLRKRLAEVEAERKKLRDELAARKPKRGPRKSRARAEIDHGTWGGYQQHKKRPEDDPEHEPCQECIDAKDKFMDEIRTHSPVGKKTEEQEPVDG